MRDCLNSFIPIITGLVTVFLTSCKDEIAQPPSDIVFPPSDVSYSQHVQPLFNQACAFVGCHDSGPHDNDLCLTDYFNTVFRTAGVVVPGEPGSSTLVLRIQGTLGDRMPPNSAPLNQNQIDGVRTWIAEGALNN